MTLADKIFGTENRLKPLIVGLLLVTGLRIGWVSLNSYTPLSFSLTLALLPWPRHTWSWTVYALDCVLLFYQLRAAVRLARVLVLGFAPKAAAVLGFTASQPSANQHLKPRSRSWWPTALLLCGVLTLSCCAITWIALMLGFQQWAPFDLFMRSFYADRALLAGVVLSLLGLTFGGRYIARAAGDVSTSFGVVAVDESHWLTERVHSIAEKLNLPKPAVGITNVMNAFAMGANQKSSMVVIGKPLFGYEKDELDAIIGHELGHILHNDVARMQFAEGFQRMLVTVVNILTVIGAIAAAAGSKRRSDAHRNVRLAMGSGRIVRKTVFVASELVAKGISRNREFHADAVGAHVTSPDAMARALKRVHGVAEQHTAQERNYGYLMFRGAGFGNLFATHPPLAARLRALDAHSAGNEPVRAPVPDSAEEPSGAAALGLTDTTVSKAASSPAADIDAGAYGLGRQAKRGFTALRDNVNVKRLAAVGAVVLVLALVAPALVSFYALDQRFHAAATSTGQVFSSSWNWVAGRKEAWFGDTAYKARLDQLEAREQAVKASEARLATDRDALARQVTTSQQPKTDGSLTNALAQRDQARSQVQDLLLKLDAANADRSALTARLAQRNDQASAPDQSGLQQQVASLTQQVSTLTADRDEMVRRNDELRQMNLELKGQIANQDMARIDLGKQIQNFQDQIAALQNGPPASNQQELPVVRPAPSGAAGGYGAFAVADNGTVILTDRSFSTEDEAASAALAECDQFSGGSKCGVRQTFRNTCAAVARVIPATRRSRYELQLEATIKDAEETALSECWQRNHRPCEVTRQVCVR